VAKTLKMERSSENPVYAIAIAALSTKRGHALAEAACQLVIADSQFNARVASLKRPDSPVQLTEKEWIVLLEAVEDIYANATRAWQRFESTDWPLGQFDVWRHAIEECKQALDGARSSLEQLAQDSSS